MSRVERLKVPPAAHRPRVVFLVGAAWLCLLCALTSPAPARQRHAHEAHAAHRAGERGPATQGRPGVIVIGKARLTIPDVEVVDQGGRRVRFYSDLIKGRAVVVNFFFTSCTFICPMQGSALTKLRAALGDRLGRDVFFVSVSRDPETDTPERLRRWGADYGVGPGWTLVTGEKGLMAKLVQDFTGQGLGRATHTPFLLVGDDRTGVWVETDGLASPDDLVKIVDRVAQAPATLDR